MILKILELHFNKDLLYSVNYTLAMKKGYITIKDASEFFNVSIQTLRRWDKLGKLKATRHPMNNYRIYRKIDLEKILSSYNK